MTTKTRKIRLRATLLAVTLMAVSGALAQSVSVPFINEPLLPTTVAPGVPGFTLAVNGTGFAQGSVVNWNGSPRATTFVNPSQLSATILASDVAAAGTATIAVTNPSVGTASNVAFFSVTWPVSSVSLMSSPIPSGSGQAVADFNGDGKPDLAGLSNGFLTINLGIGDGTFQSSIISTLAQNDPSALDVGDFNGDGKMDIAVAFGVNGPPYMVTVMLGNGDGNFQAPSQAAAIGNTPLSMVTADFNGDGKLDLAVANSDRSISLLLGNGDGTFQPQTVMTLGSGFIGTEAIVTGDFNGDGKLDLVVSTVGTAADQPWQVLVLLGNGDGTFQPPSSFATSGFFIYSIAVADFNGDGQLDLAVVSDAQDINDTTPGVTSILLGNGDGTFQPPVSDTIGYRGRSVAAADVNGDGVLDLLVGTLCGIDSQCQFQTEWPVSILLGNGDGTFQPQIEPPVSIPASNLVVGDFNGDGMLDSIAFSNGVLLESILAPSTTSVTFGNQNVGTSSSPQGSSLSNISTKVPVTVSDVQVSGADAADFAVKTSCSKLQPKSACKVNITFAPTATGTRTAAVSITDSAVGSPHKITVSGTGTAPVVSLSSNGLTFGTQLVNTSSPLRFVTLTNTGNGTLTISSIGTSGNFTQTSTCSQKINPGASCRVSIAFQPTTAGARTGVLTIIDNAPGSPQSIPLTGYGTFFKLSSGALDFGNQLVGTTSNPKSLTLSNVAPSGTEKVSFKTGGSDPGDFKQGNNCGASLAAQSSCTITITFAPIAIGGRTATLDVAGGGGSPRTVSLKGNGD